MNVIRKAWLCLTLFLVAARLSAEPPPLIRVAVLDGVNAITISGRGAFTLVTEDKKELPRRVPTLTATVATNGMRINGTTFPGHALTISNRDGEYQIGKKSFRGQLTLITRDDHTLTVVDELPLEAYLVGLINSEISSRWPAEAVKAQAVAARSYALITMRRTRTSATQYYDVTGTTTDQVYNGTHRDDALATAAVTATSGEILERQGAPLLAYYHSCCGGQTEHAHNVWKDADGPPVVIDRFCARSPNLTWNYRIPLDAFIARLQAEGVSLQHVASIDGTALADSPRVDHILINDDNGLHLVKATELRRMFGPTNIKSTWFNVRIEKHEVAFAGRGYGHGVGMCQWGAKGMAEAGNDYRSILKFYYPEAQIVKVY